MGLCLIHIDIDLLAIQEGNNMVFEEGKNTLNEYTLDLERARQSLIEELDAINKYQERIDNCKDKELKKILEHNRDEEKEHAAMLIQWLRKKDKMQDMAFK